MKQKIIHNLIDSLQGTCNSEPTLACIAYAVGDKFGEKYHNNPRVENIWLAVETRFYQVAEDHIFLCSYCGWWCELCESSESLENVCADCHEGE